ncbi:Transcriptional regulatory protein, C terminal [Streptomyces sp. yr375]|uniref:AfsR/SARP family transcriptional regulator n=1 Tax=Streptomyces sp. yr375 TaxID=1761906 RepID=UPI0008C04E0A|nr:AfsR/SARP family transcriptional regulator [Streptomyces sp. yr375]SEP93436.1 Transcriptional regulatory protein, C terminal [Streptomyces sp. yr375]
MPHAEALGTAVRVFGKMTVRLPQKTLELGPPRQRAVLALLVINAGKVVSNPSILSGIWGDDLPDHAVATLQSYVSRLRRLVGGQPLADGSRLRLQYRSPGYVLDIDPDHVDVMRFERLIGQGLAAERQGSPAEAFALLSQALREWTAPPFEDLSEYDFAGRETQRLVQLRLSAEEGRAQAAFALGRSHEILDDLEREVLEHPMRERLVRRLMQAQYCSGRQADALRVFERTRRYLADELGVDVSPELRQIHGEILRQDPSLTPRRQAALPPAPPTTPHATPPAAPEEPVPEEPVAALPVADRQYEAVGRPFVGRQEELRRLLAGADAARHGKGGVTLLLGESGAGKTSLLHEFRRACAEYDLDVVTVNCPHSDDLPAHWPWKQALRQTAERWPETVRALPAGIRATLATLVPELAPESGELPTGTTPVPSRFELHEAVSRALLGIARRPLVLVLEDLHWADAASLHLLRFLARQLDDSQLLLLVTSRTFRPAADPEMRATLAAVRELPMSDEITLTGLTLAESRELAATMCRELGPEPCAALQQRTQGNPYFLVRLLKQLTPDASPNQVRELLPDSVRGVVHERLAGLPEDVLTVLRACAVLGPDSSPGAMRDLVAEDGVSADALRDALRGGLLRGGRGAECRLEYVHPLLRDTVRQELPYSERARLHGCAVKALAARAAAPADAERSIARHARAAMLTLPPAEVVQPLLDEAEKAGQRGLADVAMAWLDQAAALTGGRDTRPGYAEAELTVQHRRADVSWYVHGSGAESTEAIHTRIQTLGRALGRSQNGRLLPKRFLGLVYRAEFRKTEAMVPMLLRLAAQENDPALAAVAHQGRGIMLYARGRLPQALAAADESMALAERAGPSRAGVQRVQAGTRSLRALAHWMAGAPAEAWRSVDDLRYAVSLTAHAPVYELVTLHATESVLRVLDNDPHGALRSGLAAAEATARIRLPEWQWLIDASLAWAHAHLGTAGPRLLADAGRSLDRGELAGTRLLTLGLTLLADAERLAGRRRQAHTYLRRMRKLAALTGEVVYVDTLPAHLTPWRYIPQAA